MEDLIFNHLGKVIATLIVSLFLGEYWYLEASCHSKTEGMGFNVEWSFTGGCRIEYKEGQWVPLRNYRIIEN